MITGLFRQKENAEKIYSLLKGWGYTDTDISLFLSNVTYNDWFHNDETTMAQIGLYAALEEDKSASLGETLGLMVGIIVPRVRHDIASSPDGLILTGPLVASVAAEETDPTVGMVATLISSGVPRRHTRLYLDSARRGGLVLGFNPHDTDEIPYVVERMKKYGGEVVHANAVLAASETESSEPVKRVAFYKTGAEPIIGEIRDREIVIFGGDTVTEASDPRGSASGGSVSGGSASGGSGSGSGGSGSGGSGSGGSGSGGPENPPPSSPEEKSICYFYAEMEDEVIVNHRANIELTISREILTIASSAYQAANVDSRKKLLIRIIPIANFAREDFSVEIYPPLPLKPETLYFHPKAAEIGEGEIWIAISQEQMPLAELVLKTKIVEKKERAASAGVVSAKAFAEEAPFLDEPIHELQIVERKSTYFFKLKSPRLDLEADGFTDIDRDRTEYIKNIYQQIENQWISNERDVQGFTQKLRAYGGQLFDELFPEKIRRALWKHRKHIKNIQVNTTEPLIPWELIHIKDPDRHGLPDEMIFLGQMGLVRWLNNAGTARKNLKLRYGHARYVIPEYPVKKLTLPQAQLEYKFLVEKFGAIRVPPHEKEFRELIAAPGNFDLLHFAGHGSADPDNILNAHIMLEGRIEEVADEESAEKSRKIYVPDSFDAVLVRQHGRMSELGNLDDDRPIVVLNACQTGRDGYHLTSTGGFADAFLKGGAGVFVGTLWAVGDRPARTFTEALYSELTDNHARLSDAVVTARVKAKEAGDATWLAYVVYGHPHTRINS